MVWEDGGSNPASYPIAVLAIPASAEVGVDEIPVDQMVEESLKRKLPCQADSWKVEFLT